MDGGALVERESVFDVASEVGSPDRRTILHAVDGDGASLCGLVTAGALFRIEGAGWSSGLPGYRCRPCQLVGEAAHSPVLRLAADTRELHERMLRIVRALAVAEAVLGDAYDRIANANDAARARLAAAECLAFAERLDSL